MPTAVLDVDFANLPPSISNLDRYDSALVLIRLHGRPVGQAVLSLSEGEIQADSLRARLLERADSSFWMAWLRAHLSLTAPAVGSCSQRKATLAVCTRDRPDDLRICLQAIAAMPDDGQEILIVDNAPSSDATQRLVAEFPRVRYVREERPGLDVARNRALREARHDFVAFTDDDAAPDPLWLRNLLRNFDDPLVMASTGLTMAMELETDAQVLFQRFGGFTRGFRRSTFDAGRHEPLLAWHAGAGVNMAVRRSILQEVGGFDPALDAGTPTCAGGDTDMFRRILAAGYRIVYDPEAVNWHRHRRSRKELRKQLIGYEVAGFAMLGRALIFEHNLRSIRRACGSLLEQIRSLGRSMLRRSEELSPGFWLACMRASVMGPCMYVISYWRSRR